VIRTRIQQIDHSLNVTLHDPLFLFRVYTTAPRADSSDSISRRFKHIAFSFDPARKTLV
jgi:hypothetical protein